MVFITREKFIEYVKRSTEASHELSEDTLYYLRLFDKYYKQNRKTSWFMEWNWCACLLGPIWLAYRGMFWVSIGAIGILEQIKYFGISFYMIAVLSLFLLIGAYGSALYLMHVGHWVNTNNKHKKGSDITMACLVFILFFCNSAVRFVSELFS